MRPLLTLFLLLPLFACKGPEHADPTPVEGPWRMSLDIRANAADKALSLPFLFDLSHDTAGWQMLVHNAGEKILVKDIALHGDSIRMRMPLFDSEFIGVLKSDSLIEGFWHNYLKGSDYRIPFVARAGQHDRFGGASSELARIDGEWETHFSAGTSEAYPALGLFHTDKGRASGTFCTETGDYRFLEGKTVGDSLYLSCFDGSHAFLFQASLDGDTLRGRYWSGNHWQEPFTAWRHPGFQLRDPDSLTVLKEGHDMADFSFPGLDGGMISPMDERFKGHVLMVQVMGSWCPNCVDETLLLDSMYAEYHEKGLDVIAIAFERYAEQPKALEALKRFRDRLNVKYDIAYAGEANKDVASAKLPFLDHVMSYPTCIFIDRKGKVRRIRTGFYGPGTGAHYATYSRNLRAYLEALLAEPAGKE